MPEDLSAISSSPSSTDPRRLSGTWVVVGMFVFGLLATGILFVYWQLHVGPFQELQTALAEAFPRSRPRVEGGQRKLHQGTPALLRIVMKVDFPPKTETAQSEDTADRVLSIARDHHDLSQYNSVEIHLYWPDPEKEIHEHVITRDPRER